MKTVTFLISLTFSFLMTVAQQLPSAYSLTVNFDPSFIGKGKLTINVAPGSGALEFVYFNNFEKGTSVKEKALISKTDISSLNDFLKTYDFKVKGSTDTIGMNVEVTDGKKDTIYTVSEGLDGINIDGTLKGNEYLKKFGFWSPKKGTKNEKLVEVMFAVLYRSLKNDTLITYAEDLQQYFPLGLGLRKLSDQPLKYKLYGNILVEDSLQLRRFFDSIPSRQKLFIDVSNFFGTITMLYPAIKTFALGHRNVYWVDPNEQALKELNEIGVPAGNIISDKRNKVGE